MQVHVSTNRTRRPRRIPCRLCGHLMTDAENVRRVYPLSSPYAARPRYRHTGGCVRCHRLLGCDGFDKALRQPAAELKS